MKKILILIITLITLTGCWNNSPLQDRVIVLGIGIDKIDDTHIKLCIQVSKSLSGNNENSKNTSNSVTVLCDSGETIFEAIRNLVKESNRKPYYGHIQLFVIGENIARDNINNIVDFFERDHESRLDSYVVVTKGVTAEEVLRATSTLDDIPVSHIRDIIDNHTASGKIRKTTFFELLREINYPEYNCSLGVISRRAAYKKAENISQLEIQGTAVFKSVKLAGFLNGIETRGFSFINDEIESCILKVPNPQDKDEKISIEVIRNKTKINVNIENNIPTFTINIESQGTIGGQIGKGNLITRNNIETIEKATEEVLNNEVSKALYKIQKEYKSDIIGFAEITNKKYPNYWKENEDNWNQIFVKAPIEIKINFEIKRHGLINKTTESQ